MHDVCILDAPFPPICLSQPLVSVSPAPPQTSRSLLSRHQVQRMGGPLELELNLTRTEGPLNLPQVFLQNLPSLIPFFKI